MTALAYLAPLALLCGCLVYIFRPEARLTSPHVKTQVEFLRERRDAVYENLRDLNFEFRAGKYPAEDYETQREALEMEAAGLLAQIDALEAGRKGPIAQRG